MCPSVHVRDTQREREAGMRDKGWAKREEGGGQEGAELRERERERQRRRTGDSRWE